MKLFHVSLAQLLLVGVVVVVSEPYSGRDLCFAEYWFVEVIGILVPVSYTGL